MVQQTLKWSNVLIWGNIVLLDRSTGNLESS